MGSIANHTFECIVLTQTLQAARLAAATGERKPVIAVTWLNYDDYWDPVGWPQFATLGTS
jgi:hypothetical protein